jgi:hypothetical protein
MGATHFVVMNGDFAKELAFEVELIVSTRDMAEGFSLMEYMRWVLLYFIRALYTNGILMLWIPQHARRSWSFRCRWPPRRISPRVQRDVPPRPRRRLQGLAQRG